MRDTSGSVANIALLSPAAGTGNVGDHFIEIAIRRLLGDDLVYERFTIREPLSENDINKINATSCALICGTNLYQHDWHSALTPSVISRIKVPVIPFGVGSSARNLTDLSVSADTREMIRALHSKCTAGGVRDPHSAEVVSHAGVENVILTGCPVLFGMAQEIPPQIHSVKRRRIVLTARNWLMHRWPDNVDNPVQINFMRRIIESFPSDQYVFAIHEEWDENLVNLLGIPPQSVFKSDNAKDYLSLYADQDNVVLAMRLHAGMLALAQGVPAVFIGHDTRTYSFCNMIGVPYFELFSDDCPDQTVASLQSIMRGDVTSFAAMRPTYEKLRDAMRQFMSINGLPSTL